MLVNLVFTFLISISSVLCASNLIPPPVLAKSVNAKDGNQGKYSGSFTKDNTNKVNWQVTNDKDFILNIEMELGKTVDFFFGHAATGEVAFESIKTGKLFLSHEAGDRIAVVIPGKGANTFPSERNHNNMFESIEQEYPEQTLGFLEFQRHDQGDGDGIPSFEVYRSTDNSCGRLNRIPIKISSLEEKTLAEDAQDYHIPTKRHCIIS